MLMRVTINQEYYWLADNYPSFQSEMKSRRQATATSLQAQLKEKEFLLRVLQVELYAVHGLLYAVHGLTMYAVHGLTMISMWYIPLNELCLVG